MIVVDASAALAALLSDGGAREVLVRERLQAPHLIDAEIASAARRLAAGGRIGAQDGARILDALGRLGVRRHAVFPLLSRVWELRDNLTAYDACYVALAEALRAPLLTADARLAAAAGIRCTVTVVAD